MGTNIAGSLVPSKEMYQKKNGVVCFVVVSKIKDSSIGEKSINSIICVYWRFTNKSLRSICSMFGMCLRFWNWS